MIYFLGMGISSRDLVYENVISTIIPCDYVVNTIFVATAVSASWPQPGFEVYHSSPTSTNRLKQGKFFSDAHEYLTYQPWENSVSQPTHYRPFKHRRDYVRASKFDELVCMAKIKLNSLPYIGGG